MTYTIWIDVEDLFEYALAKFRPSGIQRLSFEIYKKLQERNDSAACIRFVRHIPLTHSFCLVPWSDIAALFEGMAQRELLAPTPPFAPAPNRPVEWVISTMLDGMPPPWRIAVDNVLRSGLQFMRAYLSLFSSTGRATLRRLSPSSNAWTTRSNESERFSDAFAASAKPGDVLLVLGSPWSNPRYAATVSHNREKWGLRFAILIYDLIPIRRPEWCNADLVRLFRSWFETVLPLCDHVFAISRSTAIDVEAYARDRGVRLPGLVATIPIGTELGGTGLGMSNMPTSGRDLPPAGSYALIVSTIEARKNHLLLFRVWRRLLEEMPRDQVPTLVFAGRVGWLVQDLMSQIANTKNLDGKLVLIESPTDPEVAALYTGCMFTLFPSFFEGWGLPVTESLAFGKPCLISNRTSLPEAGGALARSFDPDNLNDAYAVILEAIVDRDGLARWETRIRQEFRPVEWSATADALLAGLAVDVSPVPGFSSSRLPC